MSQQKSRPNTGGWEPLAAQIPRYWVDGAARGRTLVTWAQAASEAQAALWVQRGSFQ